MSTLSQFLGGGGIKSIQRGSTEFAGTVDLDFDNLGRRTIQSVPINPVVKSKSVVTATVAGDVIYDDSNNVAINSNAAIRIANTGSIEYVGGVSSTISVIILTGLQTDDLILFFSASDNQDQIDLGSSGWTGITVNTGGGTITQPDNDTKPDSSAFYKYATGTSETVIGLPSDSVFMMIAFRGVKTGTPFDAGSLNPIAGANSNGMPAPLAIDPATTQCMSVLVGFLDDVNEASTVTAPNGYTLAKVRDGVGATLMTAYKNLESADIESPDPFGGDGNVENKAYTILLEQKEAPIDSSSSLVITIGGALAGRNSIGQHQARNQTGVIDWQVIEYED